MKAVLSLIFVLLISVSAGAHPGKTDRRGGHKCWKHCGEWELLRGEYHLHDKEGKTIRLDQRGNVPEPEQAKVEPVPEKQFLLEDSAEKKPAEIAANQKLPIQTYQTMTVYKESIIPFHSILLLLLAFLMLLLLIFVRKRKERN